MASFLDSLSRLAGASPGVDQTAKHSAEQAERVAAFSALSEQLRSCGDEPQRVELLEKLCRILPDMLFLAPMCYEGENPSAPVYDRLLHATVGAKRLYALNEPIVTKGNPGYRLARRNDMRRIHLRSIIYHRTKEEWVPLFTDFTSLLPVFGKASRVTLISFDEAREIAGPYSGLVINPGEKELRLPQGELKKA